MDSTTLTRTLDRMRKQGWISVKQGRDRREHLFGLTAAGKRQMAKAKPHWDLAESRLRNELGERGWKEMKESRVCGNKRRHPGPKFSAAAIDAYTSISQGMKFPGK